MLINSFDTKSDLVQPGMVTTDLLMSGATTKQVSSPVISPRP